MVRETRKQRENNHIKDEAIILTHKIVYLLETDVKLFDANYSEFEAFLKLKKVRNFILYAANVIQPVCNKFLESDFTNLQQTQLFKLLYLLSAH